MNIPICNVCGGEIPVTQVGYRDDFIHVKKTWGYFSPYDGETHEFVVCATCYEEWVGSFTISAK